MPDRLSGPSRREARLVTVVCGLLAGTGFASAVSPAIEWAAGWVFGAVFAAGGLWLLVLAARSLWWSLSLDRECAQSLLDNEKAVREVHRDA